MSVRIRFAPSRLGRIAHASVGSGRPLVLDVGWITHIERMWELPTFRQLVEGLADTHRVTFFDRPGCGLSSRERSDWSLASEADALRAVLTVVEAPARIFAASMGVPAAIRVAANTPDVIDRLVLYGGTAFGEELAPAELRASLPALIRSSWGLGPRVFAEIFFPSEPRETLDWYTRLQRDGSDAETAARMLELFYDVDVRRDLGRITAPTLVVHRRDEKAVPADSGTRVAEQIPNAELLLVDGDAHPPYMGELAPILAGVGAFLGDGTPESSLSDREYEVAVLVSEGLTNGEIGTRLTISPRTVEGHVASIRDKLGLRTRAHIGAWVASRRRE